MFAADSLLPTSNSKMLKLMSKLILRIFHLTGHHRMKISYMVNFGKARFTKLKGNWVYSCQEQPWKKISKFVTMLSRQVAVLSTQ